MDSQPELPTGVGGIGDMGVGGTSARRPHQRMKPTRQQNKTITAEESRIPMQKLFSFYSPFFFKPELV
jgi:hypothetical protein